MDLYAITITTKDPEIKMIHDLFKVKCEEFMKKQYYKREYDLIYEYGDHSTGWHAHGVINTHYLPKGNRYNVFYVHLVKMDKIELGPNGRMFRMEGHPWLQYIHKSTPEGEAKNPIVFLLDQ